MGKRMAYALMFIHVGTRKVTLSAGYFPPYRGLDEPAGAEHPDVAGG